MSTNNHDSYESVIDAAIIGGGPAGTAAARILAERGHRVVVFARDPDPVRAFTESLPPSACQLLATLGILDAMDGNGFVRSYGNTVWWAEREGVDERFGDGETYGFQVSRPRFDPLRNRFANKPESRLARPCDNALSAINLNERAGCCADARRSCELSGLATREERVP